MSAEIISRLANYCRRNGVRATLRRVAVGLRRDLFPNWMLLY
jgi:hypothetical protein